MRARSLFALSAAAAFLWATSSSAITTPTGGAVAFPSSVKLVLPFPAGAKIRISSGYSPTGGSSLHDGTMRTSSANDYYALDLVYDGIADGGFGKPVLAPLDGKVVKSGWASVGWANYGQRVILRHDLGDGHVYHSIYCHLNAIAPEMVEGATISKGSRIGDLGRSCMGALSCSSFSGAHLHWSIHRDSTIGGSGTGGSYGGVAVVPEPFDGSEDLKRTNVLTSTNGATTTPPDTGTPIVDTGKPADTAVTDDVSPIADAEFDVAADVPEVEDDGANAGDATEAGAPTAGGDDLTGSCSCRVRASDRAPSSLSPAMLLLLAAAPRRRSRLEACGS